MNVKEQEALEKGLRESGFFLEKEAINSLLKKKFDAKQAFYSDIDENGADVTRDIDIVAEYSKTFDLSKEFFCHLKLVGECKKIENCTIVIDPIEEKDWGNLLLKFPLLTAGSKLFSDYESYSTLAKNIKQKFTFDTFAKTHVPLKRNSIENLKNSNEKNVISYTRIRGDETLFKACGQVTSAINYYAKNELSYVYDLVKRNYGPTMFSAFLKQKAMLKSTGAPIENIKKFVEEHTDSDINPINFAVYVGIVILDSESKIYKKTEKGFEELESFIYVYPASNSSKLEGILMRSWCFPIIVCKLSSLELVLDKLLQGMDVLITGAENDISKRPLKEMELVELMLEGIEVKRRGIVFGDSWIR